MLSFREVYTSKYNKVRIFKILSVAKESKAWIADPANRICDAPGSWFCRGQYPPALNKVLVKKRDFTQLEDFNKDKKDEDYQKAYFEHLSDPQKAMKKSKKKQKEPAGKSASDQKKDPTKWADTEETTDLWQMIKDGNIDELEDFLRQNPDAAFARSGDGRGPMWWAYEFRNKDIVKLLRRYGVSKTERDKYGKIPGDYLK